MKKAFVNGQEISADAVSFELDRLVRFYMSNGMGMEEIKKHMPEIEEKALEQAIGAKLLLDCAFQSDIKVDESSIEREINSVKERVGGEENLKKALEAQKISEENFRKELEKGVRVNILVEETCKEITPPTEEDIAAFYEQNKASYVEPEQVLCRHILIKSEEDDMPEMKSAQFEKIRAIRERIVAGGDFEKEAKENSDCPSGQQGGSLGWFGRGMMVPEFDKAAFEMKKGEVSDIITTQFGYHIIIKDDAKGGAQLTLVDVHDDIANILMTEARNKKMSEFVADLREKATIEYK